MATLNCWTYFSLDSQGGEITGKHGEISSSPQTPFPVTVSGTAHKVVGSVADDALETIWDEDDDAPVDFNFMHFWSDQDVWLQVIGTTTNFVIPVLAKVPFVLSNNTVLAAANTTPLTAGVAPSVTAIDSVIVSNMSGSTANYVATFVD